MAKKCENHLHDTVAKWFAIRTPHKHEKMVVQRLQNQGIEAYLPLKKVTRRYTRTVRHLQIPLINCYIFVRIVKSQYVKVLQTPNVVNFITFSGNLIAIPPVEIELMKQALEGGYANVDLIDDVTLTGSPVRIVGGGLIGVEGVLVERQSKQSFMVELTSIGMGLLVEVDQNMIVVL